MMKLTKDDVALGVVLAILVGASSCLDLSDTSYDRMRLIGTAEAGNYGENTGMGSRSLGATTDNRGYTGWEMRSMWRSDPVRASGWGQYSRIGERPGSGSWSLGGWLSSLVSYGPPSNAPLSNGGVGGGGTVGYSGGMEPESWGSGVRW